VSSGDPAIIGRSRTADNYDKISSIGMIEHVGASHLPVYFASAFRALKRGGLS